MDTAPKRCNYLTTEQDFALETACAPLEAAGLHVFLVGSVLERPNWRDVDLRAVDIDGTLSAITGHRVLRRVLNAAMSAWLRERTGLPIDFQFQDMDENATYRGRPKTARGILIECERAAQQYCPTPEDGANETAATGSSEGGK